MNSGRTARDFCFLERNILSHFKLALLLSLLSSSFLLHARLPSNLNSDSDNSSSYSRSEAVALAAVQFTAAVAAIAAGLWEFNSGIKDLRSARAFLAASKYVSLFFSESLTTDLFFSNIYFFSH